MKTTIEINDELLREAKARALAEGGTLRELVEEGLRSVLRARSAPDTQTPRILVFQGGSGLTPEFADADWSRIKEVARER